MVESLSSRTAGSTILHTPVFSAHHEVNTRFWGLRSQKLRGAKTPLLRNTFGGSSVDRCWILRQNVPKSSVIFVIRIWTHGLGSLHSDCSRDSHGSYPRRTEHSCAEEHGAPTGFSKFMWFLHRLPHGCELDGAKRSIGKFEWSYALLSSTRQF